MVDKVKCWCGNHYVNPDTAQSAVAGVPTCNKNCHHVALEQMKAAEPNPDPFRWDVV